MKLTPIDTVEDFLSLAGPHLQAEESNNCLPYGLALRDQSGQHPDDAGTRYFVIRSGKRFEGALIQTPGRAVIFTSMGQEAVRLAASGVPEHLDNLNGCLGPAKVVDAAAKLWEEAGLGELHLQADMRLFELTELVAPKAAPGKMKMAADSDFEQCQLWTQRFLIDCKLPEADPDHLPERVRHLEERRLYLWEVGSEAVACAAWSRPMLEGITIGYVYTPDAHRGHGYASNLVAALSAGLLDGSVYQPARKRVNLFTDLANPTSNSIYRKLGYQPIGDHRHYMFSKTD